MKKKLIILLCLALFMAVIPVASNIDYFTFKFNTAANEYVDASVISDLSYVEYTLPENVTFINISDGKEITRSVKSVLRSLIGAAVDSDFEEHEVKALTVAYHTQICFNSEKNCLAIDTGNSLAYLNENNLKEKFGNNLTTLYSHIDNVYTRLIMSDGKPVNLNISALFDNYTENPDIMQTANPYNSLNSDYITLVEFSGKDFSQKILKLNNEADISNPSQSIGKISYNSNGDVNSIVIGAIELDGKEIAQEFNLPSKRYTLVYTSDKFIFTVMQHDTSNSLTPAAARFMAQQSNTYDEIINYYYRCNFA